MTNYTVDRCYDRYIITQSMQEEAQTKRAAQALDFAGELLLTVMDERLQTGCLRDCRLQKEEGGIFLDVEAADGCEAYVAATVDTLTGMMTLLAERYPETLAVES